MKYATQLSKMKGRDWSWGRMSSGDLPKIERRRNFTFCLFFGVIDSIIDDVLFCFHFLNCVGSPYTHCVVIFKCYYLM